MRINISSILFLLLLQFITANVLEAQLSELDDPGTFQSWLNKEVPGTPEKIVDDFLIERSTQLRANYLTTYIKEDNKAKIDQYGKSVKNMLLKFWSEQSDNNSSNPSLQSLANARELIIKATPDQDSECQQSARSALFKRIDQASQDAIIHSKIDGDIQKFLLEMSRGAKRTCDIPDYKNKLANIGGGAANNLDLIEKKIDTYKDIGTLGLSGVCITALTAMAYSEIEQILGIINDLQSKVKQSKLLLREANQWAEDHSCDKEEPLVEDKDKKECDRIIIELSNKIDEHSKSFNENIKEILDRFNRIRAAIDKGAGRACAEPQILSDYKWINNNYADFKKGEIMDFAFKDDLYNLDELKCSEKMPAEYSNVKSKYNNYSKKLTSDLNNISSNYNEIKKWIADHPCPEESEEEKESCRKKFSELFEGIEEIENSEFVNYINANRERAKTINSLVVKGAENSCDPPDIKENYNDLIFSNRIFGKSDFDIEEWIKGGMSIYDYYAANHKEAFILEAESLNCQVLLPFEYAQSILAFEYGLKQEKDKLINYALTIGKALEWVKNNPCPEEIPNTQKCNSIINDEFLPFIRSLREDFMKANNPLLDRLDLISRIINNGASHACYNEKIMVHYNYLLASDLNFNDVQFEENARKSLTGYYDIIKKQSLDELEALKCNDIIPSEYSRAMEEYADIRAGFERVILNLANGFDFVDSWIKTHPCPNEEDLLSQECPDIRKEKDKSGNCICKEAFFTNTKGKCLTAAELLSETENEQNADEDEEVPDCEELAELFSNSSFRYLLDIQKIQTVFDQHALDAFRFLSINSPNLCKNQSLANGLAISRNQLGRAERIRYDLDKSILNSFTNGRYCPDELSQFLSDINPVREHIDYMNDVWEELYTRWRDFDCKDEDIDANAMDLVNDPDRNTSDALTGGINREISDDGIDNDNEGNIDELSGQDPGPGGGGMTEKTMYQAATLSGSGYRKRFGGSIHKISGSQIIILTIPIGETIDMVISQVLIDFSASSMASCTGSIPLCPCAPWPDIWDGHTASLSSFGPTAESYWEIYDQNVCPDNTFESNTYVCLNWTRDTGLPWSDLPAGCQ